MDTMKAYLTRDYGPDALFEAAEIPVPEPASGEILIDVKATSLNPIDNKLLRQNLGFNPELPAVLHGDVAGVVAKVGRDVEMFQPGDEVYACAGSPSGALAEAMVADARLVALKPRTLDFASAAGLPLVAITAWEALNDRAEIRAGQHVLVHAGTGGVGHVGVQLAKIKGAKVATTVSTKEKAKIAESLGADEIIFYHDEAVEQYVERLTGGDGFDVVFDTVGGETLDRSFAAAKNYGQVVTILARQSHDLTTAFGRGLTLHFEIMLLPLVTGRFRERHGGILQEIAKHVDEGCLKPLIHERQFGFDEVNEAHALYESHGHVGKIVLVREDGEA